jgi:hypothetical protein
MIKLIIISVIILIGIAILFRCRSKEHLTPRSEFPILTTFKSGGFVGMVYELRIYNDRTYELLDHGKLKKVGRLNDVENRSVDYLISVFPTLRDGYCEVKGFDMITYGLQIDDRYVNFGTMNVNDDQCISDEIEKQFNELSKLMMIALTTKNSNAAHHYISKSHETTCRQ